MTIIEFTLTWYERAILLILYLNKGKISKQKLSTLLYLIYKKLKKIDPLENLDFYLNLKTKEIETIPNLNSILKNLSRFWEAIWFRLDYNMVYLTGEGYEIAKYLLRNPEFKDEIDIIKDVMSKIQLNNIKFKA